MCVPKFVFEVDYASSFASSMDNGLSQDVRSIASVAWLPVHRT